MARLAVRACWPGRRLRPGPDSLRGRGCRSRSSPGRRRFAGVLPAFRPPGIDTLDGLDLTDVKGGAAGLHAGDFGGVCLSCPRRRQRDSHGQEACGREHSGNAERRSGFGSCHGEIPFGHAVQDFHRVRDRCAQHRPPSPKTGSEREVGGSGITGSRAPNIGGATRLGIRHLAEQCEDHAVDFPYGQHPGAPIRSGIPEHGRIPKYYAAKVDIAALLDELGEGSCCPPSGSWRCASRSPARRCGRRCGS